MIFGNSITFPSILTAVPPDSSPDAAQGIVTVAIFDVMVIQGSIQITGIDARCESTEPGRLETGSEPTITIASMNLLLSYSIIEYFISCTAFPLNFTLLTKPVSLKRASLKPRMLYWPTIGIILKFGSLSARAIN